MTSLISSEYKAQNKTLHDNPEYGTSGHKYVEVVRDIAYKLNTYDILDYGCGKRTLEKALGHPIKNYDPCIEGLDTAPEPADLVVSTDVLEHIEPDYLDNVLDDLERVTRRFAFVQVANRPAKKILSDGRNAHLIQEPMSWWLPKFAARFNIREAKDQNTKFYLFLERK